MSLSLQQAFHCLRFQKPTMCLQLLNPVTFKIAARVPVGADLHEVIASADGKIAYVSNAYREPFHEIDVIDLNSQKPLSPVDISPLISPHGFIFYRWQILVHGRGFQNCCPV